MKRNAPFSWLEQLLIVMILAVCMSVIGPARARALATPGLGTQVFEIGVSTPAGTAVLLATGAGTLTQLELSSGTIVAQDFVTAYDSATVAGYSNCNGDGTAAAPRIANVSATAAATPAALPAPAIGRPFKNGAVVCSSALRRTTVIISQ